MKIITRRIVLGIKATLGSGMTVTTRRVVLGIGLALLVGGLGTAVYARLQTEVGYRYDGKGRGTREVEVWDDSYGPAFIGGIVLMAIGAGLIGFGALRGENKEGEDS